MKKNSISPLPLAIPPPSLRPAPFPRPERPPARPSAERRCRSVADAAGVHRSTASRALNPETAGMISPDVVARIAETAQRLGYRRDMLAASLRTSRTRLVGMLAPDLSPIPSSPPSSPEWRRRWPSTVTLCSLLMPPMTPAH